ncbi:MAG: amidohydrolase family protein, partial [Oscillospiraceae bacterium]|nr:amidohydrolase family protein [Oscillospiraceae bacterium]
TDKVLFATDSPWSGQREYVELISSLGFTDTELEKMLCGNAKKLLKM